MINRWVRRLGHRRRCILAAVAASDGWTRGRLIDQAVPGRWFSEPVYVALMRMEDQELVESRLMSLQPRGGTHVREYRATDAGRRLVLLPPPVDNARAVSGSVAAAPSQPPAADVPTDVEMVEAGRAEQKPDVYGGDPIGSEHVPRWDAFIHGDMDGEVSEAPLELDPRHWPAGTVVTIAVPVCPCCDLRADEQDSTNTGCTFDWKAWAQGWCS